MLVGSDETNYKAVEAATGRKMDVIRCYRWNGANHASLSALASAGYVIWASYKFRDNTGKVIPASSIPAHAIDGDLDAFDAVMAGLRPNMKGSHRKGYEHEEDAKAAAASGNATELNAAIAYCIGRNKGKAVAAGIQSFVCWTGYDLLNREPQYRAAGTAADVIMLDPYELTTTGMWPGLLASYRQDFDYLARTYPGKPICLGETNTVNPPLTAPAARVAWLNQGRLDLERNYPTIDGMALWQGTGFQLSPTEYAGLKTGLFPPYIPPSLPVQTGLLNAAYTARENYEAVRADYLVAVASQLAASITLGAADVALGQATDKLQAAADTLDTAVKAITG